MRKAQRSLGFAARAACLCVLALLASASSAQMAAELRRAVDRAELGASGVAGVAVLDGLTGRVIFEHRADEPLAPASNQKLLTTAAAVKILGSDYRFRTALLIDERGRVVLRGGGDPILGDRNAADAPGASAEQAVEGVGLLRGLPGLLSQPGASVSELIIDDRVFDRELVHPDWPRDQLDRWYCAPVQGVSVHANVFEFYPSPSAGGATADLEPRSPWIQIESRAQAVSKGRNAVWVQRTGGDDRFVLRGRIRTRTSAPIRVAMQEPALNAGRLLADRAGLSDAVPVRLAGEMEDLGSARRLLGEVSSSLLPVLYRCNYDSMNLHSEALLKLLGRTITGEPGSWANGAAVLRMLIADTLGAEAASTTVVRDGSGLSRQNRITARTLARWLTAMRGNDEVWPIYTQTLPSLRDKLQRRLGIAPLEQRVFAKTGTINHVRCLSGYVTDPESGRTAVFVVLCNGLRTGESVRGSYALKADLVTAISENFMELALPEPEPEQKLKPVAAE
ncbi:MAG: D-alanyl-D-alanine carboxypeptidase/D-alanyl-D-alanine-endopeptidase [Planctomycetota bacterium]